MKSIKIKNIASTLTGFAFDSKKFNSSTGFPIIRIRDLKQSATRTFFDGNFDQRYIVKRGDLLIGMDGEFHLIEWTSGEALLNQRVCKLIVDETKADKTYIKYALPKKLKEIEDATPFVTVKHLSNKQVLEIVIPLPDLQTQKQIATILEDADHARQSRKAANALTEQFLQTSFLHFFGDPVMNGKGWSLSKLENVIKDGPQNGLYVPATQYGNGTRILRIDSFYDGFVENINSLKRIDIDSKVQSLYLLRENDFVINRVNSRKYLGKSALIPKLEEATVFESNMMKFTIDETILSPSFMIFQLQQAHIKRQILKRAKDAVNQSSINQDDVKSFEIFVPPLPLQQHFASLVADAETLRQKQQQSERELEHLFQALLQRYFGEKVATTYSMNEVPLSLAAENNLAFGL